MNDNTKLRDKYNDLKDACVAFLNEARTQVCNGNKAAGARSRKLSLTLGEMLKDWRRASIDAR